MFIRRICAWCGRSQGVKEVTDFRWQGTEPVTHTICPECQRNLETEIESISLRASGNNQSE